MKIEHRDAIERARLHGVEPMVLAHQLMVHDLVEAALFELRNIKTPFSKLNEENQQEVIDRITEQANEVVHTAIGIISSRSVDTIPIKIADSKFKEKSITVTGSVDAQDPNRHGLIDLSGKLALLVLAPNDYAEGVDGIRGERDQRELPLSAAELAAGMGLDREPEEGTWGTAADPLYQEAVAFVIESQRASISAVQRKLKIGYNRAARLIEALEEGGIVTAMNSNGSRDVLVQTPPSVVVDEEQPQSAPTSPLSGEAFGGHTIDDITVMVLRKDSIDLPWLQSRFALDSDQVNSVAIQLLDANVIALETEGDTPDQNVYRVTAASQ
ncbi:cell division protein FtsK [Pseudomonas sp. HMWF032]|uniref:DNA translocase FtsK n=1 Tax=Pseudomonas sp. HMWF032 TaxID=2056866 RepID=UPI000D3CC6A0|nr:DNA translocase FtsK [Pseudomonas sp. HMWF032]PTS84019.1 cell division protein FtsK [Pseudomonas sp. HMWF032]PTT85374.1 cell division protein FtsK [Pseudomonas sp. HMWF010]